MAGSGLSRISNSLRYYTLLNQISANNVRLFREQERLSSGKNLLSVSDDPLIAEKIARLKKTLQTQDQVLENIRHADSQLSASDAAVSDVHELLIEGYRIASEQAGTLQSSDERAAQANLVDGLIGQLMTVGNQQFQGLFIFGGREIESPPFVDSLGRVTWVGDSGSRDTLVDLQRTSAFNITANQVFQLGNNIVGGYANWDIDLSADTRMVDLRGASDSGLKFGPFRVTENGVGVTFDVTVTGNMTMGDFMAEFNGVAAAAGSTLTASLEGNHLRIDSVGGNTFTIADIDAGKIAGDLGIRGNSIGSLLTGQSVLRRAKPQTALSDVSGGLSLPNGIFLDNGGRTSVVSFASANTVGDVINLINGAGVGVKAEIAPNGNGLVVTNLIAGSELRIGENGGTDADTLGIKTNHATIALSSLNGGRGLHPVDGNDIRVIDANGVSFEVDLSSATTLGDVLNAINSAATAAGAAITALPTPNGGGMRLIGPGGPGSITVEAVNLSPVASELGILKVGSATLLDGDNVIAARQSGIFALYRLADALRSDDSAAITLAGSEIEALQRHVSGQQGIVGARSLAMRSRLEQTETAVTATTSLLSQLEDVDLAEAISAFQQAQVALQASLLAGAQSRNLSLLDFLQ